eukprot:TRINITY_DN63226_c0_g1_i1.p1 TRINITY_DN63226_c0_g1~~TRINITY_DN63226_c0_g1_i1.p1  ORF type:complete len:317 (+),score=42.32 TRINITY_DN63226_c0_g1_i1:120-953(+)
MSEPITYWPPHVEAMLLLAHKSRNGDVQTGTDGACGDALPASRTEVFFGRFSTHFPEEVKASAGNASHLCNLLQHNCWKFNMTVVRALCPESCGCADPFYPAAAFFAHENWGCMSSCRSLEAVTLRNHGKEYPCQDTPVDAFVRPYHGNYIRGIFEYLRSEPSFFIQMATRLLKFGHLIGLEQSQVLAIRHFMAASPESNETSAEEAIPAGEWEIATGIAHPRRLKGCAYFTSWEIRLLWDLDLCQIGKFRSLRFDCPISCGCKKGMAECPTTCPVF